MTSGNKKEPNKTVIVKNTTSEIRGWSVHTAFVQININGLGMPASHFKYKHTTKLNLILFLYVFWSSLWLS